MQSEKITESNKRHKRPTVNADGDLEQDGKVITAVEKKEGEEQEEKAKKEGEGEGEAKKEEESMETTRLYIMNLSYEVCTVELQDLFGKFGDIVNIEIPLRKGGKGAALGIAYITFKETEGAISAFASLDKTFFQGRKLHIFPSQKKPPAEPREPYERKEYNKDGQEEAGAGGASDFKKEKEKTLKQNFDDETNWNYLFMNQDTVATSMAKKLGIEKSSLLDRENGSMAVNLAKSETIIIN